MISSGGVGNPDMVNSTCRRKNYKRKKKRVNLDSW